MLHRASATARSTEVKIEVIELASIAEEWFLDSKLRQFSARTIDARRDIIKKFFWFCEDRRLTHVGSSELKAFMLYLSEHHPEGRWGNPKLTGPMRPVSAHKYHRDLKTLFSFAVAEELIDVNPMQRVKAPVVRLDAKAPIPADNLAALFKVAKKSKRDTAVLFILLDTGLRANELASLVIGDVDLKSQQITVVGKGNKKRVVNFGLNVTKALTSYLRGQDRADDEPLFLSKRDEALTASGVFQLLKRLSRQAGIKCPGAHAFRRTFAVSMLKAGANAFAVQSLLGHSDLETTKRYVRLAEADLEEQHRSFSPADRLKLK